MIRMDTMEIDDGMHFKRDLMKESLLTGVDFQRSKSPSRCVSVILGLLCVVLLAAIVGQIIFYNKLSAGYSELETGLSNMTTERDQLQQNYKTLRQDRDELQINMQRNLNISQNERDELQRSYSSLRTDKETLQTGFNDLKREKEQLQTNNRDLTTQRDDMQRNLNNLQREKNELQTQFSTMKTNRDEVQGNYSSVKSEKDQLQTLFNTLQREKDQLQSNYSTLSTAKDQLEKQADKVRDDLTKEKEQLQQNYNSLKQEKDQLQTDFNNMQIEKDQLQSNFSTLLTVKDQLEKKVSELKVRTCESGWRKFSDSCYYVSSTKRNWNRSRMDCLAKGADLAIINSMDERTFVAGLVPSGQNTWIGLTDDVQEGIWKWADGTPVTTVYWEAGQPNSSGGNQDCGEMVQRGEWNDEDCASDNIWICEKSLG